MDEAARDSDQALSRAAEMQTVLKEEVMQDLQILRAEIQTHRGSSEAVTLLLERRLEANEQQHAELQQAHQNHSAEVNAVHQRLEVAVHECDEKLSRAGSFNTLLQEEQRCREAQSNALMHRMDAVEQIVGTQLSGHTNLGALESSTIEAAGQASRCAKQSEDMERLWQEMRKTRR